MAGKVLLTKLYPLIEKGLSKKENTQKIKAAVNDYLDRNNEKLTTIGPTKLIIFTDTDMKALYDAIEVDELTIKSILKETDDIDDQWKISNNPFNIASALAIRYYKLAKNPEMANVIIIYLTLSMYPSLFSKYYKFEPNENIMNYTINNLSNKYKIKQTGTIYAALIDTAQVNDNTYTDELIRCNDKDIVNYVNALKTRINSLMRKISNEFFKNHDEKKYLNTDSDSFEEDNYHEADSNMYAIERMTNNVVLKLVVDGPNIKLVNIAAQMSQVSMNELRNYVNVMVTNDNREEIKTIVQSILYLYLYDSQHTVQSIGTNEFLYFCNEIYKKSNTTDKNIIKIKSILDGWLEDLGTYKKTQRLATINNFRRALFMFFVLSIEHSYNG